MENQVTGKISRFLNKVTDVKIGDTFILERFYPDKIIRVEKFGPEGVIVSLLETGRSIGYVPYKDWELYVRPLTKLEKALK